MTRFTFAGMTLRVTFAGMTRRVAVAGMTLGVTCAGMTLVALCHAAYGQTYPTRPIRLVVAQSVGGNADFVSRNYAQRLSERVGKQIVVDNRPGAGGIIATEIVAHAPADGYTLLVAPTQHAINPSLHAKLPFDPIRDFAPISLLGMSAAVVVVPPQLPAKTIAELIALAKQRPGKLHFASSGTAAATHLAGELFKAMAGINVIHVAYKGAPAALVDLAAGQVEMMFASPPSAMPLVRSGRVRAIATTGAKRAPYLPDVPTAMESGLPGYQTGSWQALLAPVKTSPAIVDRVYREVAEIARSQEMRDRLSADGSEPIGSTPQELAEHLRAETARYNKVIRAIGLKLE
ncbi:MAG TPA: tripartite tricarboxylate transporter substrate binding protein [Burkholderiales bacterium]|nr:tripartite tricarboxylate transporter substrate binding protein [Burkholderiales bacterium]